MTEIRWTVRSANGEEAFRQRWIAAGILEDAPGYVFREAYRNGVELTAMQGWPGIITKGVDGEGNPLPVPGWHCNCLAWGDVAEAMTAGLAQTDAEGNLLPLMQRTWAAYVFGLTEVQAVDPTSGFPYGATIEDGSIQYGDPRDLATPANVRQ